MREIDLDFVRPYDGDTIGVTVRSYKDAADAEQEMYRYGYQFVKAEVI
jgi:hypothetical protein